MMTFSPYPREASPVPGGDPAFMEAINMNMRIPERLSVGPGREGEGERERAGSAQPPPAYTMQVPDRLTYTEAPDMSPRPLFQPPRFPLGSPLEPCWENPAGEMMHREALQSPIRRSFSDQSFVRAAAASPAQLRQALLAKHPPSPHGSNRPSRHRPAGPPPTQTSIPQVQPAPLSLLTPHSLLQAARQLGLQASQHLLQSVSHRYRIREREEKHPAAVAEVPVSSAHVELGKKRAAETWSPEEEGGVDVEFIVLRRQVMKMSRRLAALERNNTERRNTEVLLFSLLVSACLLNMWLWIRR